MRDTKLLQFLKDGSRKNVAILVEKVDKFFAAFCEGAFAFVGEKNGL